MSAGGYHVHGPHDHELEHAAHGDSHAGGSHSGGKSMTSQIAVFTAIIATVGAIFAYMAGLTQANAGLLKNDAGMKKTEASNQWAYFQAKSTKQALAEFALDMSPEERKAGWQTKIARYEQEKNDIATAAKKLEHESTEFDEESEAQMHMHHRWAQATTALQVSIALAAIALLTRKKWLEWGMFGVAGIGVLIGVLAAMHI
ncbi:DUF4337 family protein [Xylophilus rhododendri]|uniref:DUF4337 family protein n=1 Tax=Xylophilus rhododendri TaxID=2697032 RepID=A0A857J1B5_9BURK|nr:DUF4337 domain-containing protein [Xylophilus rhododendri]QHI97670.1 DUF4337 family protein [Xylophilus rhododendri]